MHLNPDELGIWPAIELFTIQGLLSIRLKVSAYYKQLYRHATIQFPHHTLILYNKK